MMKNNEVGHFATGLTPAQDIMMKMMKCNDDVGT